MIERYGIIFPDGANDATIELKALAMQGTPGWSGGLGAYQHLRNFIDLAWNVPRRLRARESRLQYDPDKHDAYIWNEWSEWMMDRLANNKEVMITGPGASWKTTSIGLEALVRWYSSPADTRIIVTSTTLDGLRGRIWKEIANFYRLFGGVGNLVQSRTMIQWIRGDDGAGIFGIAVESDGNVEKAVNKIIGRHNKNMGVYIDEMPTVNPAIVEACVNLETGSENFWVRGVGNAASHFDPHGQACEPEEGWNSVTPETGEWKTKRGGVCIHLDGLKSPRLQDEDKFPGLIRQRDIDKTAQRYGEDSPQFWQQRRGFWMPEGSVQSVLSESMVLKFGAQLKAVWVGEPTPVAGLDPGFGGGDPAVLRFAKCGLAMALDGENSTTVIELGERVQLKIDVRSKEPVHYQLVRQTKEHCETRGVLAMHFGTDATGEGGGLADIFQREWSPDIHRVEFGGKASNLPVSETNPKPAYLEYFNRVTELWFYFKTLVQHGQMRGMDVITVVEFISRLWTMRGAQIWLEEKPDMKKRFGRSPNDADAAVIVADVCRAKFGALSHTMTAKANTAWDKLVQKANAANAVVYTDV